MLKEKQENFFEEKEKDETKVCFLLVIRLKKVHQMFGRVSWVVMLHRR
jgi:hypothetical protein